MSDLKANTLRAAAYIVVETPKQKTVYQKDIDIPMVYRDWETDRKSVV